ncbi:MAG: oxidoreductase [Lysobacteraceae bacterium]|nr:MAG: oxidoreductase [Xanthomonadaceae bacterium]
MTKTILITGSTDGIGLAAARLLLQKGHRVLLHGRSESKLANTREMLAGEDHIEAYLADLSQMKDVAALSKAVMEKHPSLDVLINNAGVFATANTVTEDGLDVRFAVNTLAPYLLTQQLLPLLGSSSRVINLSSAAQSPVNLDALARNGHRLSDNAAYAQSKLALTMWSRSMALSLPGDGPAIIAVNPGSLLATKMVKDAYGIAGSDISIGANILVRAALDDQFADASGRYFDNDAGQFASPHPDALSAEKSQQLTNAIETILAELTTP